MADIGDKLRSAREAKGLSIEDIEKATKIQGRYLTAIEKNEFDKLPGDFYTRAFIRQYAQVVGLDGKELLSEYHQEVPESKPDEYVENSIDNKSEEVRETTNNKKDLWKNYLPRIGVGLGIIVAILVVYFLYAKLSANNQNNNNTANSVDVASQSSSSSTKPKKKTSSVKISSLGNNQYKVTGLKNNRQLVLQAGENATNATITINGVTQWAQNLNPNEKHSVTLPSTAQNVVVTFGNDTGTSVRVGGKKVPYTATGNYLTLTLIIGNKSNTQSSSQQNTTTNNNGGYQNNQSSHTQSSQLQSHTTTNSSTTERQTRSSQAQSSQAQSSTNNTNENKQNNR